MKDRFDRLARQIAAATGHVYAFVGTVAAILLWLLLGPVARFNNSWQLIINTATTIITLLLVVIVQNTQNRDNLALHAKIDALIEASESVDNSLQRIEDASEDEITRARDDVLAGTDSGDGAWP